MFNREGIYKKRQPVSHRYDRLPLLPSGPGGIQQELVVPTCHCKISETFSECEINSINQIKWSIK